MPRFDPKLESPALFPPKGPRNGQRPGGLFSQLALGIVWGIALAALLAFGPASFAGPRHALAEPAPDPTADSPEPNEPRPLVADPNAYLEGAEKGVATDQFHLGLLYDLGLGAPEDNALALKWYQKAAAQKYAPAYLGLGGLYEEGAGVRKNPVKAFEMFQKAAALGLPEAQYILASSYEDGLGAKVNPAKALEWYQKSAANDYPKALFRLSVAYDRAQLGLERDLGKAVECNLKAAELGLPEAQFNMGVRSFDGHGVPADPKKSLEWFTKAAERGLPAAQYALGRKYLTGEGTRKNKAKAAEWLTKAAEGGNEEAQKLLSSIE